MPACPVYPEFIEGLFKVPPLPAIALAKAGLPAIAFLSAEVLTKVEVTAGPALTFALTFYKVFTKLTK